MAKKPLVLHLFILFLGFSTGVYAQLPPEIVAERENWEEFLKTSEVIDSRHMTSREAVTNPWQLTLRKDDVTKYALWKDAKGLMKGFVEGWRWEIAAYRLDKFLGMNLIPPTVEKRLRGDRGSCQLWIDTWMDAKTKQEKGIGVPSDKKDKYNKMIYLMWAFDNLIANEDRHSGNIIIDEDWRLIAIDHSRSFRASKKFVKQLINCEKSPGGPRIVKWLPRSFVEKLKTLNFEIIREVVGDYVKDKEIDAVLIRRDMIIQEIERRVKRYGARRILYETEQ